MASYVASCSTLYNAGGSGSNTIPDGYVRAVEKIWLDSFTWGLTTSPSTSDTILIGYIPANKKCVGCEVYVPTTLAPTSCCISVGPSYSSAALVSYSAGYVGAIGGTGSSLVFNVVRMNNPTGMGYVFTSSTTAYSGSASVISYVNTPIYLTFHGSITAPTIGTITTILRYT